MDGLRTACDEHVTSSIRQVKEGAMAAGPGLDVLGIMRETKIGPAARYVARMLAEDSPAVERLVDGCDGIVHLGGRSVEDTWEVIRSANIDGMFNLYEAARKTSKPRIVFASSNHAIGYHRQTERLDAEARIRPDGLYGVSKVFGEAIASMYHDKFGIETACVRIGSCFPEPRNQRMMATWLSYDDFVRLIERVFAVPVLGCPIIYGASDNDVSWWDNGKTGYLGWRPQDNSEAFRAKCIEYLAQLTEP
jgi:uronate dehydrogenase